MYNQCSEKTLSHRQLASVVIDEGQESYTTNLCQMCFNNSLKAKGEKNTDKCAVETGCGEKGVTWKDLEDDEIRIMCTWDVGILSPRKKQSEEVSRAG